MTLYLLIKLIHILSSTILFGTGIGTATVMLYAHFYPNLAVKAAIYRYVVIADWVFTGSSIIIQPISGLILVYLAGYPLTLFWLQTSLILYSVIIICWIIVVYLQIKIRSVAQNALDRNIALPKIYYIYIKKWFILGWPAFLSLLFIFYLMVVKI